MSSNTVEELLKPAVLTLAMLLPTTSIIVWWLRRPETAEKRERSIWVSLGTWVVRRQPAELDELAELD